ncbi:MAG TPA: BlaI/MecI/CopY family transcriptional regulator [Sphingomicrobium sp.]
MHIRDVPMGAEQLAALPPQVQHLAGRERELASKIYLHGPMTAEALEAQLSTKLSNSAIRSMLARLCEKGVLTRRRRSLAASNARKVAFVYLPAITPEAVKRRALEQLAADYFDGSLLVLLQSAVELLTVDEAASRSKFGAASQARPSLNPGVDLAA